MNGKKLFFLKKINLILKLKSFNKKVGQEDPMNLNFYF